MPVRQKGASARQRQPDRPQSLRAAGAPARHGSRQRGAILRAEHSAQDRVAFLRERRAGLQQRVAALSRAMDILDDKIAYCT
ncbi:hypothetical protein [Streptomyces sp. SP18CS02]|uniref:hypothetical protein n=1 Tax=Streptomyces sp. SP18CS02 TaxID=3002531 RepID=UPI002E785ABC|nr:hypothetical protein [Streptomyces sp. SP18CS02]MEE1752868.1 hypothetical protein [Streptomyces sp. SP18CS02]